MAGIPKELDLEKYIVEYLTSQPIITIDGGVLVDDNGDTMYEYHQIDNKEYDRDLCFCTSEVVAFLKTTQPKEWNEFVANAGSEANAIKSLCSRLNTELSQYGTLKVLKDRNGLSAGYGVTFRMVYFRPVSSKNAEHEVLYHRNRVAVMRQFMYSNKDEDKNRAIDLAIFVNGLPVATIELKNALTGQTHENAIKQYMQDRPVKGEKALEFKRILVHFACGTEQVYMTTRLAGEKTRFFPFNRFFENKPPKGVEIEYKAVRTEYLWRDVLCKDSLLNLLQNYLLVQENEEKKYDKKSGKLKTEKSEALIFPRYHQHRAVEHLLIDQREKGAGHRYLIEHSAGSGKSNTITWLAFRLSNFFRYYTDNKPLFDTVFVVTDRLALNSQIAKNIRQFQMTEGEVAYITDSEDGKQKKTALDLKKAIEDGKKIIVTNIQKFPSIAEAVQHYSDHNYAVIIDEAHSSQSGRLARDMRKALSLDEATESDARQEQENDEEKILYDAIEKEMTRTGVKNNVSYFAFTATPKPKTIELFCETVCGVKEPFDTYSMKQAIDEGFIIDVLENYMSFKRYYKLVTAKGTVDSEYEKKKTVRLLSNYVDLQDAAIEKKSRIMLEHFVSQTEREIDGEARAMLVTRSRLHAVRYKLKFDAIMQEMHLPYKALVAFSGTVKDAETNQEYTEVSMNNLGGTISIPEALKLPKFRILIVAMKYQTGFDEPNLHTMFVDKKLGDTSTVQTLSRLNRTRKGKGSTMVLDFVNNPDDIQADFQQYYGRNYMLEEDETDSNTLYELQSELYHFGVFEKEDIHEFAKYYFLDDVDKVKVNKALDRVCDRAFEILDAEQQEIFRKRCRRFSNLYNFLSQIITFKDADLAQLAPFCLALFKKMPYKKQNLPYEVLDETQLDSYKIKYMGAQSIGLSDGDSAMKGQTAGRDSATTEDELDFLSNIIKMLNDTYGLELTEEDKVELSKMRQRVVDDEQLMAYFNTDNARDDVKKMFEEKIDEELLNFINAKLELYNKLTEDRANGMFKNIFFNELYDQRVRGMK